MGLLPFSQVYRQQQQQQQILTNPETLFDLLELYTHNRNSTTVGPHFPPDRFLTVRIPLNKEAEAQRLPRYTHWVEDSRDSKPTDGARDGKDRPALKREREIETGKPQPHPRCTRSRLSLRTGRDPRLGNEAGTAPCASCWIRSAQRPRRRASLSTSRSRWRSTKWRNELSSGTGNHETTLHRRHIRYCWVPFAEGRQSGSSIRAAVPARWRRWIRCLACHEIHDSSGAQLAQSRELNRTWIYLCSECIASCFERRAGRRC